MSELVLEVEGHGTVSAIYRRPRGAIALYVLAHGAGAGMRHPFMEAIADSLADERVATLRFQFPYTEAGKKRPDPEKTLAAAIAAAVDEAARRARGLPIVAGGKSMGGRITAQMAARGELREVVKGLVFLGFPLHAANEPNSARGKPLRDVAIPMLFLQGSRDPLASLPLLRPIVRRTGATLHVIDQGDHSFAVPKRSGRDAAAVMAELAAAISGWIAEHFA